LMTEEEKKNDEEASQPEEGVGSCFVTIFFEAPGSAIIAGLQTRGISLNQISLAARELQNIVDFEQWWAFYSNRMKQVQQETSKRMEEEMIRRALAQGVSMKPS